MKSSLKEQKLTIYLEGEINSNNASIIEQELLNVIKANEFNNLILNIKDVTYISSAGLRIILKVKQLYNNVEIIDASLEVYDIFNMTGFTNIMTIRKKLNEINVDGCELIGEGYCSYVYRIDKDTIIKVFKGDVEYKEVERELNLAKEAFVLGIPTAISFDVVTVKGHYGVRFEMLDSLSLKALFLKYPEDEEKLIDEYTKLLKTINTTSTTDTSLPDANLVFLNKLNMIKELINQDEFNKIYDMAQRIPKKDTFVHGDCHIKNIMSQDGELFLIDMDTLSRGNPIFELSAIYATYIIFEECFPGNNEQFLGISKELSQRIIFGVYHRYITNDYDNNMNKIALVAYLHIIHWAKINGSKYDVMITVAKNHIHELINKVNDLDLGI